MADVFISYSRDHKAKVAQIAQAIARDGFAVWWDAEIPPHRSYSEVIQEKVGAAKAVVVVWSASAAASEWVRAEADLARTQRKLVQTSIEDILPPIPFNQIQVASLSRWNGSASDPEWKKVRASLEELCGRPAPTPQPLRPSAPRSRSPWVAIVAVAATAVLAGIWFIMQKEGAWLRPSERGQSEAADKPSQAVDLRSPQSVDPPQAPPPVVATTTSVADEGFIFPDSDRRLLTARDILRLSRSDLRIARNEIFARRGRTFQSPDLQAHFSRFAWYRPQRSEVELNSIEEANVQFLLAAEERQ